MIEVVRSPEHGQHWIDAAEGRAVDWNTVFAGYRATVDWPACDYWRELALAFPDAKVILSVRDPESWYRSTQGTIFNEANRARLAGNPHMLRIMQAIAEHHFAGSLADKDGLIAAFNRHNAAVQNAIPAARLLVYRRRRGGTRCAGFWVCRFHPRRIPRQTPPRNSRLVSGSRVADFSVAHACRSTSAITPKAWSTCAAPTSRCRQARPRYGAPPVDTSTPFWRSRAANSAAASPVPLVSKKIRLVSGSSSTRRPGSAFIPRASARAFA